MTTSNLNKLIGLTALKQQVGIQIIANRKRGTIYPHSLLVALGGLGKTAFVRAIALDLNYHLCETEGDQFKTRTELYKSINAALSEAGGKRLMFFIDEIHQLSRTLQEALYYPMVESKMDGKKVTPFCLFAATTRIDLLDSGSFVTRFHNVWQIERYSDIFIQQIIAEELRKHQVFFNPFAIISLSKRCLGIPRIAVRLASKVHDYILAKNITKLEVCHIDEVCYLEGIDGNGLSKMHRCYLEMICEFDKPIGLGTIASKLGVNKDTVCGSIEPILLNMGLVMPTACGRQVTDKGRDYLKGVV